MSKLLIIITSLSTFLFSNFIGMNNGACSLAMGNAYTALSDESITIFYNPAGLARINQLQLKASRQNLFGVSGLYSDMISIVLPTPALRTGFAVQKISLADSYSEQIVYLSLASIIKPNQIPIRFGLSLKHESVKVEDYDESNSPEEFDIDMGIIIDFNQLFWMIFIISLDLLNRSITASKYSPNKPEVFSARKTTSSSFIDGQRFLIISFLRVR